MLWENWAAHQFQLLAVVPQKGKKIKSFLHSSYRDIFCQEVIALLTRSGKTKFLTDFWTPLVTFCKNFWDYRGKVGGVFGPNVPLRVAKTPSARQQCWPESFCKSGKFLRQVHYWLENFWILCNTKYQDNMQSVRMNWKVSGQSRKCPDNLENVFG